MPRLAITIEGVVQGVGFRPFVYTTATRRGLSGWVRNDADGVRVEVEGDAPAIEALVAALAHPPPAARIDRIATREVPPRGGTGFEIRESEAAGDVRPTLPADQATCADCAKEIDTPGERRHGYPFTNCTRCGPRYSIIEALPYDRPRTAMRRFPMCAACAREYADPADRRFHAQPIACAACGPTLALVGPIAGSGVGRELLARGAAALEGAAEAVRAGRIVALKGLGGYQLVCDATSEAAVRRLRQRKRRDDKPLAVMFPSLESLRSACSPTSAEEEALCSPEAPIVLVRRRAPASGAFDEPAPSVAPRNPRLGAMLPYTPLHRILLARVARPVVCTSGNVSEEPMCTTEDEAYARLGGIADTFLTHDRPIVRPIDDSVARIGPTGLELMRRARGSAPLSIPLAGDRCVLALGAQLKNTVALAAGGRVVVSQHVGDLGSPEGASLCARVADDLVRFFAARPERIACDLHPDYASTRIAEQLAARWEVPLVRVQHHHAHVAACIAEHRLAGPVLGLAWDGAGLGSDGALWGGEALVVDGARCSRVAHLRPFSLPGGEAAIREPRRAAAGLLHEIFGASFLRHLPAPGGDRRPALETADRVLARMLERGVHAPRTTSVGRLFDAIAAIAGVRARAGFEGQAAMELEHLADSVDERDGRPARDDYQLPLGRGEPAIADWEPLVRALLRDHGRGVARPLLAARFHDALADLAGDIAIRVGLPRIVLSGGCFQNLRLSSAIRRRLVAQGFEVYSPRLYPPNDGGIALGQAYVAGRSE